MSGDQFTNDLARKRPVWLVLSELWLDTELQPEDLNRIAGVLRHSGYASKDLEQIYKFEVAPVVWRNMFPFYPGVGEWAGFDPDWLEESILTNIGRQERDAFYRWRIRNKVSCWLRTIASRELWQKCLALLEGNAV